MNLIRNISLFICFPILFTFFVSFVASTLVSYLTNHILIFPIIEETAKLIALLISTPVAIVFTLYFSFTEFFYYLYRIEDQIGSISVYFVKTRFVCVILHSICLYIQYLGVRSFRETGNRYYVAYGFILAIYLHYLWNAGGGIYIVNLLNL